MRHGAFLRARRRRSSSQSGPALRLRHLDEPQDARRTAGGLRPLPRGARVEGRSSELPRHAGRPVDARDRGKGRLFPHRDDRRVQGLPDTDPSERGHALGVADRGRVRRPHRRHRYASGATRPPTHRVDRARRPGAPRGVQADREPQHGAVRRAAADGRVGRAPRALRPRRCAASTRTTLQRSARSSSTR